ncbi:MAG: hypothetical protein GY696_21175 [Gammaproteobacteria bacterium]|nr:hypothetical protein [Gammaproteobacteria bacterium]
MNASGDLEAYPDHVVCQGEEIREGDKLTDNALVHMELRVMIQYEKFLASHKRMESKSEHMELLCNVPELGCKMGRRIYIGRTATASAHYTFPHPRDVAD